MPNPSKLPFARRLTASAHRLGTSVLTWFLVNTALVAGLLGYHFSLPKPMVPDWWPDFFAVASNLLVGALVSFLFYYLVVFIPERQKRRIIKTNLKIVYQNVKHDILWEILSASIKGGRQDLDTSAETHKRLMNIKEFRAAFRGGREANEGYYAFQNEMTQDNQHFQEIIINLTILSKQIDFVLHNYSIENQMIFDFFKRLEAFLIKIQYTTPGYDESKIFCGFIYQIFSGWNVIDGYLDYDLIEKMIADI